MGGRVGRWGSEWKEWGWVEGASHTSCASFGRPGRTACGVCSLSGGILGSEVTV